MSGQGEFPAPRVIVSCVSELTFFPLSPCLRRRREGAGGRRGKAVSVWGEVCYTGGSVQPVIRNTTGNSEAVVSVAVLNCYAIIILFQRYSLVYLGTSYLVLMDVDVHIFHGVLQV